MKSFLALTAALFFSLSAQTPPKYEPEWVSLMRHQAPQWFHDAKLGIFVHWGLYSVPAFAPPSGEPGKVDPAQWFTLNPYAEWYSNSMRIPGSPTALHHARTYGPNFAYLDFLPQFNQSLAHWDPGAMAAIFRDAGARYVVLTSKHHDGFPLWPTKIRNPHRRPDQQFASRDVVGSLTRAVRAQGLKMGLYYSGGLDWSFVSEPIRTMDDLLQRIPQSAEYAAYADAQWRELIATYQPSILWNDIGYPKAAQTTAIFAEYYNQFPDGVINDRFAVPQSDFTTPEYSRYDTIVDKKWESCRGLGFSFGYNQVEGPEQVIAPDALIHLLIDIVSKNGNLLLNVGPRPDGSIPEIQLDRLRHLGAWLRTNGEAIYDTRPWVRPSAKTTAGLDVRFTRKSGAVYAIFLGRPKEPAAEIEGLVLPAGAQVTLLGSGPVSYTQLPRSVRIHLPANFSSQPAYSLKITPLPALLIRE